MRQFNENQEELFHFLADAVIEAMPVDTECYASKGSDTICSKEDADLDILMPFKHEERDTHMILQSYFAAWK